MHTYLHTTPKYISKAYNQKQTKHELPLQKEAGKMWKTLCSKENAKQLLNSSAPHQLKYEAAYQRFSLYTK